MFNVGSQGYQYQLRQQCRQTVAKHKELNKKRIQKNQATSTIATTTILQILWIKNQTGASATDGIALKSEQRD